MIRYIRFPFEYDEQQMQAEVNAAARSWNLHFNEQDYKGDWSGLSLRSPGGSVDNLFTDTSMTNEPFASTLLMQQCPYIQQVVSTFLCEYNSVRLLKLSPGAIIKKHRDRELNFEAGEARLHIPITTHPLVEFYLDGDRLLMEEGSCWYVNANLTHSAVNNSDTERVHLVIDCVVNDWLTDQFNRKDLPVKSIKHTTEEDLKQDMMIIALLRASGDPVRIRYAEEKERELGL